MLHLFHPAFVHFSVAFLVVGGLCESVGAFVGNERARRFGNALILLGVLSLLATVVTGYLAVNSIELPHGATAEVDRHEKVGWLVAAVFVAGLFWKAWFRGELPQEHRIPHALLLLLGVGLVVYGALLGGEMVYLNGVGVLAR
jgi:uncharacterized membrane protein